MTITGAGLSSLLGRDTRVLAHGGSRRFIQFSGGSLPGFAGSPGNANPDAAAATAADAGAIAGASRGAAAGTESQPQRLVTLPLTDPTWTAWPGPITSIQHWESGRRRKLSMNTI